MADIAILHPGQMGISVAASAQNSGSTVHWASEGRSQQTRDRAEQYSLVDDKTMPALCASSVVIVSVCPPHAAEDVAEQVCGSGFRGLYVEANAISPQRTRRIGERMTAAGIVFVDGGIVGGPAWEPGKTWLYLSGERAADVQPYFSAGPLETEVVGDDVGVASALKMCYASYTKGTTALLSTILAAAEALGVRQNLETQWERNWEGFVEQTRNRVRRVTAKSWRFEGEMREIAATFQSVNLPGGFHEAAAEIYHRTARFKDAATTPGLDEVIGALLNERGESSEYD